MQDLGVTDLRDLRALDDVLEGARVRARALGYRLEGEVGRTCFEIADRLAEMREDLCNARRADEGERDTWRAANPPLPFPAREARA